MRYQSLKNAADEVGVRSIQDLHPRGLAGYMAIGRYPSWYTPPNHASKFILPPFSCLPPLQYLSCSASTHYRACALLSLTMNPSEVSEHNQYYLPKAVILSRGHDFFSQTHLVTFYDTSLRFHSISWASFINQWLE